MSQTDQPELFYGFSLDRHVPSDHLLRSIDRFVDLGDIREQLRPFYSDTGRPSIDPELMIRMLIIGYCMGIRSERRLCDESPSPSITAPAPAPGERPTSSTQSAISCRSTCR